MIKLKNILKEIGEASLKPYKYTIGFSKEDDEVEYNFKTDSGLNYEISMYARSLTRNKVRIIVAFKPVNGSYDTITNKNEQYRIMATVVTAVKEYLAKVPKAVEISFTPSKADENDMRRANLYKAYITKQLPGSKIEIFSDGRYIVELPKIKK